MRIYNGNILIKHLPYGEVKTDSGLITVSQDDPDDNDFISLSKGVVVQAYDTYTNEHGVEFSPLVKAGDIIYYHSLDSHNFPVDTDNIRLSDSYKIINEHYIKLIFNTDETFRDKPKMAVSAV